MPTFLTNRPLKTDFRSAFLGHFGSSLQGYGTMEWMIFFQSLKKSNKPNFNHSSDTWVVVVVLFGKPMIGIPS